MCQVRSGNILISNYVCSFQSPRTRINGWLDEFSSTFGPRILRCRRALFGRNLFYCGSCTVQQSLPPDGSAIWRAASVAADVYTAILFPSPAMAKLIDCVLTAIRRRRPTSIKTLYARVTANEPISWPAAKRRNDLEINPLPPTPST